MTVLLKMPRNRGALNSCRQSVRLLGPADLSPISRFLSVPRRSPLLLQEFPAVARRHHSDLILLPTRAEFHSGISHSAQPPELRQADQRQAQGSLCILP